MRKSRIMLLAAFFAMVFALPSWAEETRDLREGVTGEMSPEKKIGILPRFKSNPDTGIGTGIKLKAQNIFGTKLLLDLANIYTTKTYQNYEFLFVEPRLLASDRSWLYAMLYIEYDQDPDLRYFGIGNETTGTLTKKNEKRDLTGDEASFNYRNALVRFTLGYHPGANLYVAFEPFYRNVWLRSGDPQDEDIPSARKLYANDAGGDGGQSPGLGFSIIQTTRNEQWRPTRGYRLEARFEDVGPYMGADFDYSKYILDFRYYRLLFGRYNVAAAHLRIEAIEGIQDEIPWWEMSSLGGRDTLRGFWEGRFHGQSSALLNLEYRYFIYHFKPDWQRIKFKLDFLVDGNLFFDAGQVVARQEELNSNLSLDLHTAYGFGFRMTTPPNLMGRLDIGFSKEQSLAMYFNFGTVFYTDFGL